MATNKADLLAAVGTENTAFTDASNAIKTTIDTETPNKETALSNLQDEASNYDPKAFYLPDGNYYKPWSVQVKPGLEDLEALNFAIRGGSLEAALVLRDELLRLFPVEDYAIEDGVQATLTMSDPEETVRGMELTAVGEGTPGNAIRLSIVAATGNELACSVSGNIISITEWDDAATTVEDVISEITTEAASLVTIENDGNGAAEDLFDALLTAISESTPVALPLTGGTGTVEA